MARLILRDAPSLSADISDAYGRWVDETLNNIDEILGTDDIRGSVEEVALRVEISDRVVEDALAAYGRLANRELGDVIIDENLVTVPQVVLEQGRTETEVVDQLQGLLRIFGQEGFQANGLSDDQWRNVYFELIDIVRPRVLARAIEPLDATTNTRTLLYMAYVVGQPLGLGATSIMTDGPQATRQLFVREVVGQIANSAPEGQAIATAENLRTQLWNMHQALSPNGNMEETFRVFFDTIDELLE